MTELNQNFTHVKGDTRELTIPVVNEAGNPVDISGSSARWRAVTETPVIKSTAGATISLVRVNGALGELDALRLTIQPVDTISLKSGNYRHEAEVVDLLGNVSTVTKGVMKLADHDII